MGEGEREEEADSAAIGREEEGGRGCGDKRGGSNLLYPLACIFLKYSSVDILKCSGRVPENSI